jgi:hypothetical protein
MPDPLEINARHAAALGQLAELGLALAADLQRRALAAEDDDTAAKLADSFHKVGRSVRQTLALEAKLLREQAVDARELAAEDARTRPARIRQRQREVRREVERLIWNEVEDEHEAEVGVDMLRDLAAGAAEMDADFADAPLDVIVARLKDLVFGHLADYRAERQQDEDGGEDEDGFEELEFDASPEPERQSSG